MVKKKPKSLTWKSQNQSSIEMQKYPSNKAHVLYQLSFHKDYYTSNTEEKQKTKPKTYHNLNEF